MKRTRPPANPTDDLRARAEKFLAEKELSLENLEVEDVRGLIHKLHVHQVELEMQNDQLRRAQAELEGTLAKYTDLYDFAPVAYFTLDKAGLIWGANLHAAHLLGVERSRLLNTPLTSYILPPVQDLFRAYLGKVMKGGESHPLETRLQPRQGVPVVVQLTSSLLREAEDNPLCRVCLMDITARRQAEISSRQQQDILTAINRIFQKSLTCETEEELGRTCLTVAEELTGSYFGFIGEINRDGRLDTIALSDPGWKSCRLPKTNGVKMINNLEIRGIWGRVLNMATSQIVNDPGSDPDRVGLPAGHPPLTSYLGVPLQHEGRTMGLISLANKAGGYDQSDLEAVEALSLAVVEALMRKRAEVELARRAQELARANARLEQHTHDIGLLSKMADLLQSCHTVAEAYSVIQDSLGRLFSGDSGALFIFSASRNLVQAAAVWGDDPPPEQVFAPDTCWALRRGKPQVGGVGTGAPQCVHVPSQTGAYLCVPLTSHGEILGLLHVLLASPEQDRLERMQWLALSVAGQLGLALTNLKMQESLRDMAVRDPLTGLFNRRYLEETLEREFCRATRQGSSLALIMLDIDHFKRFNDNYGHDAGDVLLRELGPFLQRYVRGSDVACRYGGEEFILTMPGCSLETACQRAEALRQAVKILQVHCGHRTLEAITLSFGVAAFPDHGDNLDAVLQATDAALYRAKQEGRDRVVAAANSTRSSNPS